MFCGRCELTPYCSVLCQKKDWIRRHRSVCHNLARLSLADDDETDDHDGVPSLRRPHQLNKNSVTEEVGHDLTDNIKNNDGKQRKDDGFERKSDSAHRNSDGFQKRNDDFQRKNDDGFQKRNDGFQRNNDGNQRNNDGNQRNNDGHQRRNDGFQRKNDSSERFGDRKFDSRDGNQRGNQRGGRSEFTNRSQTARRQDGDEEEWPATTPEPSVAAKPASVSPSVAQPQTNQTATATKEATTVAKVIKPTLRPEHCVIDKLSIGETVMISVIKRVDTQVICLSLSPAYADGYEKLCEEYLEYCEKANEYVPNPGDLFSLLDSDDGGWYRARCLDGVNAALIDAGRVVDYTKLKTREVDTQYGGIVEYCCVMDTDGQCNPNDCFSCDVKSRDGDRVTVSRKSDAGSLSDAVLTRWTPPVTYKVVEKPVAVPAETATSAPVATSTPSPVASAPTAPMPIPSVPRPALPNKSCVLLVHIESRDTVVVKEANPIAINRDDMLEAEVAHYGLSATPLTTPPRQGDVVVVKYTDGVCYRALVRRTSVKQNKYLLEYIEFGKEEIAQLERLYPCPADLNLSNRACHATIVSLDAVEYNLTDPALEYLNSLKDKDVILVVSDPSNKPSIPNGSPVTLLIQSNGSNVNQRVAEMCKPDWKKVEEKGVEIYDTKPCMMNMMSYLPLPAAGSVSILDSSALETGVLAVCPPDCGDYMNKLLGPVTTRMTEYCNSKIGSEPYMPRPNELCLAKCPPHEGWFRAAMVEQIDGPGSEVVFVLYLDYGNVGRVTTRDIRKMMSEYVDGLPALASSVDIEDFPSDPTPEMLSKARAFLQIPSDDTVGGILTFTSIKFLEPGSYKVAAPALIAAMKV